MTQRARRMCLAIVHDVEEDQKNGQGSIGTTLTFGRFSSRNFVFRGDEGNRTPGQGFAVSRPVDDTVW
jgi:hypothetical protein